MKWLELLPRKPTQAQRLTDDDCAYWHRAAQRIAAAPVSRAVYAREQQYQRTA